MSEKRYKCNCGGVIRQCYHPCNAGCCPDGKPASVRTLGRHQDNNPASKSSFGFTKNFDGRIRGGIKTKEQFTNPTTSITSSEYAQLTNTSTKGNCRDKKWASMPQGTSAPNTTWWGKRDYCQRCQQGNNNFPVTLSTSAPYFQYNPSGTNYCNCCEGYNPRGRKTNSTTKRLVRQHPLDVLNQKRVMGQEVYDPISKVWKDDDLRPRGLFEDPATGKKIWGCWGKCKVKKFFITTIKCNCNKSGDGCACDGCMDNAQC